MAHFGDRLSSVRTPIGHRNIMQTEINEPTEGDYFTIKKDGEDWPIVICDEEIIRSFFADLPRPRSARQADGTWEKDYKCSINDRLFPAIYLGSLEFLWASMKELEPIDIDMGRAIRDSTTKTLLAVAWGEYISQYNKGDQISDWKYLEHWKAKLHAQRLDHATPGGFKKQRVPTGKVPEGRKRKGTPVFRYPPGYRKDESDDEESEDLFLPKGQVGGPKIKGESIPSEDIDALYCDADPPYPTSAQSSKRSKLDLSGRFSMRPSGPFRAGTGRLATPMSSSIPHGTPSQPTNKKDLDVNDPNTVIIYVDNPHKMFKVKRIGLDASPLLSNLLMHHPSNGWYIWSPMLSALDADDFQPIGEYIDRREYHPNIMDDGTIHVRLEGNLNPEMLRYQTVRCSRIYQVAQMLEMPGLQDLAFRKLKALESHYQPLEILTVIDSLFEIGSAEIRQYLTQYVADTFYTLILAETKQTVDVMTAHENLARGVYEKLSGKADGIKTEAMKEEGKEDTEKGISDEPNKNEKVDETSHAATVEDANMDESVAKENKEGAGIGTNKSEKTDETITQTEEEMVRMALRQSDAEQTEEDWVQLVQKQSDLFEAF